jgi:hypothetical protein
VTFGKSLEEAQAWVRDVDERNADRIDIVRSRADFVVES